MVIIAIDAITFLFCENRTLFHALVWPWTQTNEPSSAKNPNSKLLSNSNQSKCCCVWMAFTFQGRCVRAVWNSGRFFNVIFLIFLLLLFTAFCTGSWVMRGSHRSAKNKKHDAKFSAKNLDLDGMPKSIAICRFRIVDYTIEASTERVDLNARLVFTSIRMAPIGHMQSYAWHTLWAIINWNWVGFWYRNGHGTVGCK